MTITLQLLYNPILLLHKALLSEQEWDRQLGPPDNVRDLRNQVADLLGIPLTEKDRKGPPPKKTVVRVKDEFASYESLVQEAGR